MTSAPPQGHPQRSDADLAGRRVLIVGGGSRMGLAVARAAAARGADVIISSRSAQRVEEAAATIGGATSARAADFSVPEQAAALIRATASLDHLVVTASSDAPAGGVPDTTPEVARAAFARFWIAYHALHFAPGVVRDAGSITLLSGSSGRRPMAGVGVWGTLHGSIEALARSAVLELAPIRVNVVSPGGIAMRPDRQLTAHANQPEDVAAMVLALMSNPAVTNAVVDVDSGERLGA